MSLNTTSWGGLMVTEANGATEFVGLHVMAVLVLIILILLVYPSIAKLINSAPTPADAAAQKFGALKVSGRTVPAQRFDAFNASNNRFGTGLSGIGQNFLGVPEAPNFAGDAGVSQNLLDVTLDSIKAEGASGLGALGDLAKADMIASSDPGNMKALEAAAAAMEKAAKASGGSVPAASGAKSQKFSTQLTALGL